MFTPNREDYLRALYVLEEEKGELKSIDLANYLNISKPSVSEMIRELDKEDLISFRKYSKLKFTAKGRKYAQKLLVEFHALQHP